MAWLRARDVVPTIVDLRQHVDGLREAELAWAMDKLEDLSDQQRNVVLAFSQRLVNKILHEPTIRLKQHANEREAYRYTEAVRDLFGIDSGGAGQRREIAMVNVVLFLLGRALLRRQYGWPTWLAGSAAASVASDWPGPRCW